MYGVAPGLPKVEVEGYFTGGRKIEIGKGAHHSFSLSLENLSPPSDANGGKWKRELMQLHGTTTCTRRYWLRPHGQTQAVYVQKNVEALCTCLLILGGTSPPGVSMAPGDAARAALSHGDRDPAC